MARARRALVEMVLGGAFLLCVAGCSGDSTGAAPPEPPPPAPRVAVLEISGPSELPSRVDPAYDDHVCEYVVSVAAKGDSLSTARWVGADVSIGLGIDYEPIQRSFDSTFVAAVFGPSPVRHGEVRTGKLGFRLVFPPDTPDPWTRGAYWANWTLRYHTAAGRRNAEYRVRCSLPPPLPGPVGRFALHSIDDKPLPAVGAFATTILADTLTFAPDSTYDVATVWQPLHSGILRDTTHRVRYPILTRRTIYLPVVFAGRGGVLATYTDSTLTVDLHPYVWKFRRLP